VCASGGQSVEEFIRDLQKEFPQFHGELQALLVKLEERQIKQFAKLRGTGKNVWLNAVSSELGEIIKGKLIPYSFMSTDAAVIEQLPAAIAQRFPAVLTPKRGLDRTVVDLLDSSVENKACFEAVRKILVELHALEYYRTAVEFLSMVQERRRRGLVGQTGFDTPPPFPEPSDRAGYDDFVPSTEFVQQVAESRHYARRPSEDKYQNTITGARMAGDHSFKVALRMILRLPKSAGGLFVKPFSCFYNWVTEFRQVAHQRFAVTKSRDEIVPMTEELRRRCGQVQVNVHDHAVCVIFFFSRSPEL
jgi:hypothetical protein